MQAGFVAALPYLVMGIVVMSSGWLADCLRGRANISTTLVRKAFTCGGKSQSSIAYHLSFTCVTAA